jgi:hypothetical protein
MRWSSGGALLSAHCRTARAAFGCAFFVRIEEYDEEGNVIGTFTFQREETKVSAE